MTVEGRYRADGRKPVRGSADPAQPAFDVDKILRTLTQIRFFLCNLERVNFIT